MGHEVTNLRFRKHKGAALFLFLVGLFLTIATIYAVKLLVPAKRGANQVEMTLDNIQAIQSAIYAYVAVHGYVPCPANPTAANDGVSDPAPSSVDCGPQASTVPWATLGISPEVTLDGWNRKISFQVFDGVTGVTRPDGASMVNCDSNIPNGGVPLVDGLCNAAHTNSDTDFLALKGLKVNDLGTVHSGVAFVLISHGETGYGAYLPGGGQIQAPIAAHEANNTTASATFYKDVHSAPGIEPSSASHFDDILAWTTISDLAKNSGLQARDWPEISFDANTTADMTSPSTDPLNPHFMTSATTGQGFTPTDGGTAVEVGVGSFATFSSCLWWPAKLNVVNGTSRNLIAASIEFAAADMSSGENFPGFTLGFLSGSDAAGPPTNSTCGTSVAATTTAANTLFPTSIFVASSSGIEVGMTAYGTGIAPNAKVVNVSSFFGIPVVELSLPTTGIVGAVEFSDSKRIRRDLGWAGGSLASYTNRFAVEVDSNIDVGSVGPPVVPTANDPSRPHLAVDFTGVTHGTDASSCTTVGNGLPCDSEIADFAAVTRTATGLSGGVDITITDLAGITGIVHGMSVSGVGIGPSAKVISLSGNVVTLSVPNTGAVSDSFAPITFSSLSTANFMQNGLTVFHNARVEVSPNDCVPPTGTGAFGGSTISVSSNAGIASGMSVYGIGVSGGAKVTGVSGTTVTLSSTNSGAVSGTVVFGGSSAVVTSASGLSGQNTILVADPNGITQGMTVTGTGIASGATVQSFSGSTVTLSIGNTSDVSGPMTFATASPLTRTLVKTWTLSNAGCNESPVTCTALKNTSIRFTADLSANRQAMHAVSCIPAPTVVNAYDSLYFGITTANRESYGVPVTNVKFRKLYVHMPLLP